MISVLKFVDWFGLRYMVYRGECSIAHLRKMYILLFGDLYTYVGLQC